MEWILIGVSMCRREPTFVERKTGIDQLLVDYQGAVVVVTETGRRGHLYIFEGEAA
ncbi:hypothetical protein SCG7086_AQ_00040 [Chlamydiales bacterium SCGC AG-110-P3]|nr:hypothetical protein SCG7086_AQ_00040 [Chlamydiales bacterium SCGC AG-110-P3]